MQITQAKLRTRQLAADMSVALISAGGSGNLEYYATCMTQGIAGLYTDDSFH